MKKSHIEDPDARPFSPAETEPRPLRLESLVISGSSDQAVRLRSPDPTTGGFIVVLVERAAIETQVGRGANRKARRAFIEANLDEVARIASRVHASGRHFVFRKAGRLHTEIIIRKRDWPRTPQDPDTVTRTIS